MSGARWAGVVLAAGGVMVGSALDTFVAAPPARAGGYYIVAADFHVHAFPGDGALPPSELAREAARRSLHAIVVSNHNQTFAARFGGAALQDGGAALQGPRLPLVIPAQEITTPRFHLIAAGVTRTIDWRLPDLEIVRAVHAQGGVVIGAHPVGRYWKGSDALLASLDGAEVAHPVTGMLASGRDELTAFFVRARAVKPGIAPIGSSDFHMVAPLGVCRTYVFAESLTTASVLDAIRAGRTVAHDQDGVLYGDPSLTLLLDQSRAAGRAAAPRRGGLVAAAAVLLGLLVFVVAG